VTDEYRYHVWGPPRRANGRPDLSEILPDLLVGEYPTPDDAEWLHATHGVTAVVSLQDDADLASKGLRLRELEQAYRRHGVHFHRIPVPDCDNDTLAARLDESVAVLRVLLTNGGRVYLHCNAGMNRAPTIAIAYLHAAHGLSLAAARDFVKQRRHCVPYMSVQQAHFGSRPEC
jgi:protein-tyrosine phosphatase